MICPFLSKQILRNTNGVEFISPQYTECLKQGCGCWSMINGQCGMIGE
jgi:hypothetical protein